MNINILMIYYVWWDWHKIKKLNKCNIAVSPCYSKSFLWGIHCCKISNLMTVQISQGKVPYTCKELIKAAAINSPPDKRASNLQSRKTSQTYHVY